MARQLPAKLYDLKSEKEIADWQDDLLMVERDVADGDAIAAARLRVFVAWKLSREQVGPSAGKIAEVLTARQKRLAGRKEGRMNRLKISVPDRFS